MMYFWNTFHLQNSTCLRHIGKDQPPSTADLFTSYQQADHAGELQRWIYSSAMGVTWLSAPQSHFMLPVAAGQLLKQESDGRLSAGVPQPPLQRISSLELPPGLLSLLGLLCRLIRRLLSNSWRQTVPVYSTSGRASSYLPEKKKKKKGSWFHVPNVNWEKWCWNQRGGGIRVRVATGESIPSHFLLCCRVKQSRRDISLKKEMFDADCTRA